MIIAFVAVFFGIVAVLPTTPKLDSPAELASWSECKPEKIAVYLADRVEYTKQENWESASEVMARGKGDCKGRATTAKQALDYCGYFAEINIIKNPSHRASHAIVVYEDTKGNRGYIDGPNYKELGLKYDWDELIHKIPGGPWIAYGPH